VQLRTRPFLRKAKIDPLIAKQEIAMKKTETEMSKLKLPNSETKSAVALWIAIHMQGVLDFECTRAKSFGNNSSAASA
jgi:hypothetical protein